jgi:GNAT superfamily N-acetyltransferase
MKVRERTDADLDTCVAIAHAVHELDGYPPYLPTDLRAFLAPNDAYAAWVVERGGEIVGHVALHRQASEAVMVLAGAAAEEPVDRLAVVARLFVAPPARRHGVGRLLLDVAARDATGRGLWPVLEVATQLREAIRLYEARGWIRAGELTLGFDDGSSLDEFVYVGPRPRQDDPGPVL